MSVWDLLSTLPATEQTKVPMMGMWHPTFTGTFLTFAASRKMPSELMVPGE